LNSTLRVTIQIQHQLQCNMTIWNSNSHKGFIFPSQGIWQWLVFNNTRPTHIKIESEYWHVRFTFYYQVGPNFITKLNSITKSMVEINPSLVGWPRSTNVWWLKKIMLPHDWWQNAFGHHSCGEKKIHSSKV